MAGTVKSVQIVELGRSCRTQNFFEGEWTIGDEEESENFHSYWICFNWITINATTQLCNFPWYFLFKFNKAYCQLGLLTVIWP